MGTKALQYIFHHVVFPPRLPLEPEGGQNLLNRELLLFIKAVLGSFVSQRTEDVQKKWKPALNMVDTWLKVDPAGTLNRHQEALAFALLNLRGQGAVALHIAAQNCGWLAYYDEQTNTAIIDAFEASSTLSSVQGAPGPIIRCFPGQSVSIPIQVLDDPCFCDYLAQSLCSLDLEVVREMYPKAVDSSDTMEEDWDTVHPGLVTEKVMVELLAFGEHNVWKSFEKHTYDEVLLGNARHPWRRSPLWFVLRVALQTVLYCAFPDQEGRFEYKNLMLYLVAEFASVTLTEIESSTTHPGMPDVADVLALTRAKLARRIYKLRDKALAFVLQGVKKADEAIAARLQTNFQRIRDINSPEIPPRFDSAREIDYETSFRHSHNYLRHAKLDTPPAAPTNPFRPNHRSRKQKQINGLFRLEDGETESLVDFETWVDTELQDWCSTAPQPLDKTCCGLAELIGTYSRYASKKYAGIPESTSLMLLIILECWVSLDKLCIKVCPSLAEFSPELPKNLLQHLLLPRRREMKRAQAVEEYIAARLESSEPGENIFEEPGPKTFAARFFKDSRKCRLRRAKIVENFQKERDDRQRRCKDLGQKYEELINEASMLQHDTDVDEKDNGHLLDCRKCQLQQDAKRLSIGIHEWPLPDDEDLVENVVFELTCPEWFAQWRDVTWMILDDYGRSQGSESSHMEVNLLEYPALRDYHDSRPRRLTLASATKSWVDSHFSTQKFPVGPEQIVVSNELKFCLWDTKKEAWVKDRRNTQKSPSPNFKNLCTFAINAPAYAGLQYAVDASHHGQNQIIAQQRAYQSRLNLHNMVAFGQLRSGERLQWYNILRELASSSISLNEKPVHELFCQAAWQLGPYIHGKWLREAHVFFEDMSSVIRLLETLEHRLNGIQHNWNEIHTLHTIVILGLRSLSLGPPSAGEQAISLLRRCRKVAMEWCAKLKASIELSSGKDTQGKLTLMLRFGGICLLTFSVDHEHLVAVLHTQEDLQFLVQSSILVFQNSTSSTGAVSIEGRAMVLRTNQVLCHAEHQISLLIKSDCSVLTCAIERSGQVLQISTPWRFLEGNNERWVTNTSMVSNGEQQQVHYNILTGELRIDNELSGRLPEGMTKATSFQRLFGKKPLLVARSRLEGSRFKTSQLFGKYRVYFRFYGGEVIVFAREEDKPKKPGRTLRYIPHESLQGDFPDSLVTCYAHWLDIKDGKLEFRPLEEPWKESESNWSTEYQENNSPSSSTKQSTKQGNRVLVDVHSEFFGRVASVLGKLDTVRHITVTKSPDGIIEVKLARLNLTFFVNDEGALECRENDSIVDSSQDIGCLYGLFNKLVLRDKTGHSRTVLIPYGTVRVGRGTSHTEVSIEPSNALRVKYYQYSVDVNLGALLDTSGMTGSLYLAYLHAVTSFVLPDAITNRSGTEEALHMLRQAKMKSSSPLDSDCVHLLGLVASLTPHRQYYPPSKTEQKATSVQKVRWTQSLSSVVQHDDFRRLAQEIYSHAGKFAPFHDRKMESCPGLLRGDIRLLERARNRNMHFYISQFGGASAQDVPLSEYKARDRSETESARSRRVYEVAKLVQDWPATLSHRDDLIATFKPWGVMEIEDHSPGQSTYSSLLENPIQTSWASLYGQCQSCNGETDKHKLMSIFCTVAFGHPEVDCLQSLLAVAVSGGFPPIPEVLKGQSVDLTLKPGQSINNLQAQEIKNIISTHYPPPARNCHKGKNLSRKEKDKITRERRKDYDRKKASNSADLERAISIQWPCGALRKPAGLDSWKSDCFDDCDDLFRRWSRNVQFYLFIQSIQKRLDAIFIIPRMPHQPPALPPRNLIYPRTVPWQLPSLHDLMLSANAPWPMETDSRPMGLKRSQLPADVSADLNDGLLALIDSLQKISKHLRQTYARDLSESLHSLKSAHLPCAPTRISTDRATLVSFQNRLSDQRDSLWAEIKNSISPVEGWTEVGQALWPSVTILSVLSLLASNKWSSVPAPWKKPLLVLAKLIVSLRQSERLIVHFDNKDSNSFYKEAEAMGCEGWDPSQIPEWLLLEIEGNLTIRARQAEVAKRMIEGQENSVLQLTMGEGKTTVITPMVALRLSNGSQISRLIVLKPLLWQSMTLLPQRLGGILNRPVYHIPFSRSTRISETTAETLMNIYDECLEKRGVLVVLPEQLLSFRLVGLDWAKKNSTIADSLIEVELHLQERCRTVIDESDEVLDPKFQLVYTRGHRQNLDGETDRWGVIMHVLKQVKEQAMSLHSRRQGGLRVEERGARYPIIHFLETNAADILLENVLEAIENGAIPGLSFQELGLPFQVSTMNFIRYKEITDYDKEIVRRRFEGSLILKRLLVLRGLFAHNILHFALTSKRWFVDYGIHPTRCLLAVPYRAKGIPSDSAMFGHPEVALVLTCLSYYHEGLTPDQVRKCVSLLKEEDDPEAEYARWTTPCRDKLPLGLHLFSGVNLDDTHGFEEELYPPIRYQMGIIDFFLSRLVFPSEAKEFPSKLSTSAWDIPSRPNYPLTTGFSGTNDNQYLLPSSMAQNDLPDLVHTNAMVLARLLLRENQQCILAQDDSGDKLSVDKLLLLINDQNPRIRVLIDVGAQILELSNRQVATQWLSLSSTDLAATVFFDEEDEPMVIDRDGHMERLLASPFSKQMQRCLVFLDQYHSRGVDLKLPHGYRAAVTLGSRLTKDRLVQACHRMRELGNGHSVAFFMPPEVRRSLKTKRPTYTSFDVLQWVLEQTCDQLEKFEPLWAAQGLNHFRAMQVWESLDLEEGDLVDKVEEIQEPESKSLRQLYSPWGESLQALDGIEELVQTNPTVAGLYEILRHSESGGNQLHEEQEQEREREVMHEVQREQHVCLPPPVEPEKHTLSSDIKHFVKNACFSGYMSSDSHLAIDCFATMSLEQFKIPDSILDGIFVSTDFIKTITQTAHTNDEFLKPVNWVLSNVLNSNLMIISQFEANALLPCIRGSEKTTLHIYAPRITKDMRSFSKLDFLSIGAAREDHEFSPEILRTLELFSGSLYFDTYEEYESAQHYFGFRTASTPIVPEDAVTSEGFVAEHSRNQVAWPVASPFKECPIAFLSTWFSIRQKGHGFSKSHMGSIIEAKPLTREQFEGF